MSRVHFLTNLSLGAGVIYSRSSNLHNNNFICQEELWKIWFEIYPVVVDKWIFLWKLIQNNAENEPKSSKVAMLKKSQLLMRKDIFHSFLTDNVRKILIDNIIYKIGPTDRKKIILRSAEKTNRICRARKNFAFKDQQL